MEPRPPSVRSNRSARSDGSRAKLALRHRHEQLKAQILKDMQLVRRNHSWPAPHLRSSDCSHLSTSRGSDSEDMAAFSPSGGGRPKRRSYELQSCLLQNDARVDLLPE